MKKVWVCPTKAMYKWDYACDYLISMFGDKCCQINCAGTNYEDAFNMTPQVKAIVLQHIEACDINVLAKFISRKIKNFDVQFLVGVDDIEYFKQFMQVSINNFEVDLRTVNEIVDKTKTEMELDKLVEGFVNYVEEEPQVMLRGFPVSK